MTALLPATVSRGNMLGVQMRTAIYSKEHVITTSNRKSKPPVRQENVFTPGSYDWLLRRAKQLRKAVGKEALSLNHAHELLARLYCYESFNHIRTVLVSGDPPPAVWDWQLNETQLRNRKRMQVAALMTFLHIDEVEASRLLFYHQ
jgi:hypothetical protein